MIVLENVSKVFAGTHDIALRSVSLKVRTGSFICIIGPSGCGKSSLLKIVAGIEQASSGHVQKPTTIAMVFQNGALFPWLTVFDNIAFGLQSLGLNQAEIDNRVFTYMEMVGLRDLSEKYPRELSGGQRQRVGIARALAVKPSVLLLDEPFSALDVKTTDELHHDIVHIWQETGITIVMVSHLIEEAVALGDEVVLMNNGQIVETFPITLHRPRHERGSAFVAITEPIRQRFLQMK